MPLPFCRVVVERVLPEIDGGRFPIKRTVGESLGVTAWVHADGHDALAAVLRYRPVSRHGRRGSWVERPMHPQDNDEWVASFVVERHCDYEYTVEAWVAGDATDRAGASPATPTRAAYGRTLKVSVDRDRARFGAWYEMFPRSWGPDPTRSATFREAAAHLPRVAAMGFDVVYLPPIHPIGKSFRKGRGNALSAAPGDPGSPWAIGSEAGGHKAVDPGLGTLEDFDHFVARPPAARPRSRARYRLSVLTGSSLCPRTSGVVPPSSGRHHQVRREPAQEISGYLSARLRMRGLAGAVAGAEVDREFWAARGVLIFRVDNPAHQAVPVLGMADPGGQGRVSGRHFPGGSVHPSEADVLPGQAGIHAVLHVFHLAEHEGRAHRVLHRAHRHRGRGVLPSRISSPTRRTSCTPICRRAVRRRSRSA